MLSFESIGHIYHGSSGDVEALAHLTLKVAPGDTLALIGPSGCGKSTALLLAAGLLAPTSGRVWVAGQAIARPRFETGLILQDFGLLPWKTVLENAALGLRIRRLPRAECHARAAQALEQVGLADFARHFPDELSGGMRQRLALARALALDVDLLLMDEPLSAVDALLRESLQDLLLGFWRERGYAQVLVTHSIEEAVFLGRQIAVMGPRPGSVANLIDNPAMGSPSYRAAPAFFAVCGQVRDALSAVSFATPDESDAGVPAPATSDAASSGVPASATSDEPSPQGGAL
jgi:NitT/TauT family transport system ATP-binding protein